MRASRLLELVVRLQLWGDTSASRLAEALEVSVRTIYRDIEALSAAGIPVYTETGRTGGVRIDPSYRVAGLPRIDPLEARAVLFAAVPAIAERLGLDGRAADRTLLPALERSSETAARVVRDRLLVEPSHWFVEPEPTPALVEIARAVWESVEVCLTYRDTRVVVEPWGLVLKGDTWYLLGKVSRAGERLFRISRVDEVELRSRHFQRPDDFDLAGSWQSLRDSFVTSLPSFAARVRVAPDAEWMLGTLDQTGRPALPLPTDTPRDPEGWAELDLRFERMQRAVRQLLPFGAGVEVLDPPPLRELMVEAARDLAALYEVRPGPPTIG